MSNFIKLFRFLLIIYFMLKLKYTSKLDLCVYFIRISIKTRLKLLKKLFGFVCYFLHLICYTEII